MSSYRKYALSTENLDCDLALRRHFARRCQPRGRRINMTHLSLLCGARAERFSIRNMRMKTRYRSSLTRSWPPLLLVAAAMPAAATNGYFMEGYGIKNDGVAGAGIAFPAGLTHDCHQSGRAHRAGSSFDAGLDVFLPRRGATFDQEVSRPATTVMIPTRSRYRASVTVIGWIRSSWWASRCSATAD